MAEFVNLHDVSEVLLSVLRDMPTAPTAILSGPPPETADGANEEVRVTLMWVTQQPTHRSDPWERSPSGQLIPPPLTLTGYFMITTYGSDEGKQPLRAHQLLGDVMRTFHARPELSLPLPVDGPGTGPLTICQVPSAADLMEKLFSPVQLKHRPWVLYEVAPIQLKALTPVRAGGPLVAPDGIRLDVAPIKRPSITRIAPATQRPERRIRIEANLPAAIDRVVVGGTTIPSSSVTTLPDGVLVVTVPAGMALGPTRVSVVAGGQPSEVAWLEIAGAGAPALDALTAATSSRTGELVLTGQNLDGATSVAIWPDQGIAGPGEIDVLPVASAAAAEVRVSAANIVSAQLGAKVYRIAVAFPGRRYTPHILARFA